MFKKDRRKNLSNILITITMKVAMTWLALFVLVLGLKLDWTNATCPTPEVVSPCTCYTEQTLFETIACNGFNIKNLKTTFDKISNNTKKSERHFYKLVIRDTLIDHFESCLTGDLIFDYIEIINNQKLQKIHHLAFNQTAWRVKYILLSQSPKLSLSPAPYNLFDMLNKFVNIKSVLIRENNITSIPDRAFYNLTKLNHLTLNKEAINYISANAFKFRKELKQDLTIYLSNCNLNSTSFYPGWLSNINRPVELDLAYNRITFLNQNVFQPFLDGKRNNRITDLARNPLNCSDCRNAWLKKNQKKFKSRVVDAYCDGIIFCPTIFKSNFSHCLGY